MKTLYLIRHAKAEDHAAAKPDYDRNLVSKGRERAQEIATKLATELTITAQTEILSSSANRAIQTAELFAKVLNYPTELIRQDQNIYEARHLDILNSINQTPDDVDTLLVFGHNPGLSDLTHYLTGSYTNLNTSHIAVIQLEDDIDFGNLSGHTATLKKLITEDEEVDYGK